MTERLEDKWFTAACWIGGAWLGLAALAWAVGVVSWLGFGGDSRLIAAAALLCFAGMIFSLFGLGVAYAACAIVRKLKSKPNEHNVEVLCRVRKRD